MNPQMLNMKPIVSLLVPHYDILLTQLYYWWRLEWVSPHNYEMIPSVITQRLDIMSKFRLSWAFLVLREGMKLYFASEGMKKIFHQQIDRFRHGPDAKMVIMGGLMTPNILNYGYIYHIYWWDWWYKMRFSPKICNLCHQNPSPESWFGAQL